jgi:hypothetical protein
MEMPVLPVFRNRPGAQGRILADRVALYTYITAVIETIPLIQKTSWQCLGRIGKMLIRGVNRLKFDD